MSDEPEDDYVNKDGFLPGTWGCHEALHMAAFLENAVREELVEHPAVQQNEEWAIAASDAMRSLQRLYQLIGGVHLSA